MEMWANGAPGQIAQTIAEQANLLGNHDWNFKETVSWDDFMNT